MSYRSDRDLVSTTLWASSSGRALEVGGAAESFTGPPHSQDLSPDQIFRRRDPRDLNFVFR